MLQSPLPFIAGCVVLLMMNGAERYGEFVADFEPNTSRLSKADMMGMAWRSAANDTRLLRHEAQMLLGSDPFWCADREHVLVDLVPAPSWVRPSDVIARRSLLRLPGLTKATAQCRIWSRNIARRSIDSFVKPPCFTALLLP